MASQHHDTGYKEVFSYPEFVQQLIEGFMYLVSTPPLFVPLQPSGMPNRE